MNSIPSSDLTKSFDSKSLSEESKDQVSSFLTDVSQKTNQCVRKINVSFTAITPTGTFRETKVAERRSDGSFECLGIDLSSLLPKNFEH